MAGFPLGGGGHHSRGARDDDGSHPPGINPSSSSSAAAFLYATTPSRGGFQLWQGQPQPQHEQQQHPFYGGASSSIIRFADDPAASGSSSRGGGRGSGAGAGAGTISCQDCGNQAKKDCPHMRCRTCCKSRGFDCATHVKSTWVPAARRRERHHQQPQGQASAEPFKRPREGGQPFATTPTTTSSGEHQQQMMAADRFPREVSSEAVFRCVRLGPVDEAEAEVAYQTTVSIGGHVFKGILHDVGPDTSITGGTRTGHHAAEGSSPSTAAAGGAEGGSGSTGAAAVSSSAVVMDPYPTPGPYGAYGGAPFFHGHHPR
ncbi:hypothetical protein ACQJBY_064414 [Aegilops geniculata]